MARLLQSPTPELILPLVQAALDAARDNALPNTPANLLTDLFLCVQVRNAIFADEPHMIGVVDRVAANRVLTAALESYELIDGDGYTILTQYYFEKKSDRAIAAQINYSRAAVNRKRPESVEALAAVLCERELNARRRQANMLLTSLPSAPYDLFFGRTEATQTLTTQLISDDAPGVISIVGIGGMGKTALAHHVVREAIPSLEFDKIVWLTVQSASRPNADLPPKITFEVLLDSLIQRIDDSAELKGLSIEQRLHYVGEKLSTTPHLIVVDNIEIEADVIYILNRIQPLARRSKFLVTSRVQPHVPHVYTHRVQPLSQKASLELLQSRTGRRSPSQLDALVALAKSTSGHPLALRLVASQVGQYSGPLKQELPTIQDDADFIQLLDRLYAQKWAQLSDATRTLWLGLPLMPDAAALETHLQYASGLSKRDFQSAINQMLAFSLLEVHHSLTGDVMYAYHQLTQSFALERANLAASDDAEFDTRSVFVRAVGQNIAWWQQEMEDAFLLRHFQQHEIDLKGAISFGLAFEEVQEDAVSLLLNLFNLIDLNETPRVWLPLYETALSAETSLAPMLRFRLLNSAGWFYWMVCDYDRASTHMHDVEHLAFNVLDDDFRKSQSEYGLAWLAFSLHQYDETKRRAEHAIEIRRALGMAPATYRPLLALLGMVLRQQGNADAALEYLTQSLTIARAVEAHADMIVDVTELIAIHGALGNVPMAESCCDQALSIIDSTGRESMRVRVLAIMAQVYNDHALFELAHQKLISAENTAHHRPHTDLERALLAMQWGRLYLARERFADAQRSLEPTLDTWRNVQNRIYLGQAMFLLSLALRGLKRSQDAAHLRQQAVAVLQAFRDTQDVRQLLGPHDG